MFPLKVYFVYSPNGSLYKFVTVFKLIGMGSREHETNVYYSKDRRKLYSIETDQPQPLDVYFTASNSIYWMAATNNN